MKFSVKFSEEQREWKGKPSQVTEIRNKLLEGYETFMGES